MAVNLPLPVAADLSRLPRRIELGHAEATACARPICKDLLVMRKLAPPAQPWPACSPKNRFCAAPVQVSQAHLAAAQISGEPIAAHW